MIRVLHVVGSMQQGGTENFLMNLYRNIDREKIQFDFLVNRKGVFEEEIEKLGGKIYYIDALQKVGQRKYIKNLDNFLIENKSKYNIIHSHINQVSGLILERANKAGIPVRIAHSHNNKYGKNVFVNIYKRYLRTKINKNANYKFACSKQAGIFLFGKNSKFEVINNFIDTNKFIYNEKIRNEIRKNLKIDKDCFVIGNVARLSYQKNPLFLLKIFNEFIKLNENSKLLLIGKGNLKNQVIQYIDKNKLNDKVIMLEDRNDVNDLMQAMDYFVLPSRFEGLGIVLIEAQASGLRCITSKDVVAKEAKISDLLTYFSLDDEAKKWATFIFENKIYERKNMLNKVIDSGFDINDNIIKITNFYLQFEKSV